MKCTAWSVDLAQLLQDMGRDETDVAVVTLHPEQVLVNVRTITADTFRHQSHAQHSRYVAVALGSDAITSLKAKVATGIVISIQLDDTAVTQGHLLHSSHRQPPVRWRQNRRQTIQINPKLYICQ